MALSARLLICPIVLMLILLVLASGQSMPTSMPALPETTSSSSRPAADVGRLIRQLNHPSLQHRQTAMMELAKGGRANLRPLREALSTAGFESQLMIRELIDELESVPLLGARVRLEITPEHIRWSEPVTLKVHVDNPTRGDVLLPWPAPEKTPASGPSTLPTTRPVASLVEQTSRIFDVAEFLDVQQQSDGSDVEFRADDITQYPSMQEMVQKRISDSPPRHLLPPGRSETLYVDMLNRAWARFPMLVRDEYQIRFQYQPQWENEDWIESNLGRISSNMVSVKVTEPAPELIQQAHVCLKLEVERINERLHAILINTWDVPVWLNLNFGMDLTTRARLVWLVQPAGAGDEGGVSWDATIDAGVEHGQLAADRLIELQPGQRIVLHEEPLTAILRKSDLSEEKLAEGICVACRYVQLATLEQLSSMPALAARCQGIRRLLYVGTVQSEGVPVNPQAE